MGTLSRVRIARIEKILAADLNVARRVARLEKIAADETQHPACRVRAFDQIWQIWTAAALATPNKAAPFFERARVTAAKAEPLRQNDCDLIRARIDALRDGKPLPATLPDPDAKHDPDSVAARSIRKRLEALAAAYGRDGA